MTSTTVAPSTSPVVDEAPAARAARTGRGALLGRRANGRALPLTGLVGLAVVWELTARTGLLSPSVAPSFSASLAELGELARSNLFWDRLTTTVLAWAYAVVLGAAIAIPLGVLLGVSDRAYRFVRIPVEAMRTIPPVVLLPLALLVLGGDVAFRTTLVVHGMVWLLLVQTVYGIRTTDPVTLDTARSYRLGPLRRILFVRLPSAAPMILTGLRLAGATAFGVTLVTELVGGAEGIGELLVLAQVGNDTERVYALTIATGLVGLAIAWTFHRVERSLVRWQPGGDR